MKYVVVLLALIFISVPFANAIEINPSVESQPFYCRYQFSSWICDIAEGTQGPPGPQGIMNQTPNLTSIFIGSNWYLHNTPSPDKTGYLTFNRSIPTDGENISTAILTEPNTEYLIMSFISYPGDPGIIALPAGERIWYTFGKVSSTAGGGSHIVIKVNRYFEDGTEKELYNLTTADFGTSVSVDTSSITTPEDLLMNETDRFSVRFYGVTESESNPVISLYYDGNTHVTKAASPILQGVQGPPGPAGTAINESYAYLPGRAGGQTLTGGTTTGNLVLNGSMTGGNVIINPNSGKVGVGISDPVDAFHLYSPSSAIRMNISSDNGAAGVYQSGVVGTNSQVGAFNFMNSGTIVATVAANSENPSSQGQFVFNLRPSSGTLTQVMRIKSTGFVSIGTITQPTAQLHTTGTVRFANYGAGTATFDAGGNITSVSDEKYKTSIKSYTGALSKILAVQPITYKYNAASGLDTQNEYTGFSAQNLKTAIPEAVFTKEDVKYVQESVKGKDGEEPETITKEVKTGTTTMSINDRALIAALINALKEEDAKNAALEKRIAALEAKLGTVKV